MRLHLRGVLLPGGAERDIFVTEDGRFSFDGSREDARTLVDGGYLTPGLVDAHAHLAMLSPAPGGATPEDQSRASARAQLAGGVLALREPGSPHRGAAGIGPDEGLPRTSSAGRFLAAPGRYLPGLAREVPDEQLPAAATEELLAAGGTWAKFIGDWFDAPGGLALGFRAEVLAEATRAVHEAGGRVAIHAIGREAVEAALAAGCDSIEHATFATKEQVAAMARAGIAMTPTLSIVPLIVQLLRGLGTTPDFTAMVEAGIANQPGLVRAAWESDGLLLAGSDSAFPHGRIDREIASLHACGIPAEVALGAGSWDARRFLGLPGIEEGAPADIVAYARDPREDLEALADPQLIILDGRIVEARTGAGR